uniref:2-oxoglutarate and iron-dependent oxygenase JMJD4 n=1 Tax=Leptobrachium leishanense TaxID=445787 RepID=A0A8C5MB44_9ANUR
MDGTIQENPISTHGGCHQITFIEDPGSFSYDSFFHNHLVLNAPCLFSAKFTESWGSRKNWVTADKKPDWDHLLQNYGGAVVPVANCDVKEYNSNPKDQIPLREYICYWRDYSERRRRQPDQGCRYLKDWHMLREFPDHDVYNTPEYFSSDWLNEYWDAIDGDDYRFVYMGPAGSWTPFHADVFRSYSWSANICGRKKWLLFPPGQEEHLRDHRGSLAYDVTSPLLQDLRLYPKSHLRCLAIEVIQEAGQVIFVPSGWHHQVHNLEDTISINHNWVNGCNVAVMWRFLQAELEAIHVEIGEWRETMDDWDAHCQVIMKSCTGIDYTEFYVFLKMIAENRLRDLQRAPADATPGGSCTMRPAGHHTMRPGGPQHNVFDINKVLEVLTLMTRNEDFQKLDKESLSPPPRDLMKRLQVVIAEHTET